MAKRDGLPYSECRKVLSVRDVENEKLYKKIYGIDFGKDLRPFDLVVETDAIDESKVAEIVIKYVKNRRD
jgi:cytidylate kinase